jgi:hypothetical protein
VIYAFDEADADLTLIPMASRRALDAAGLKLSLASYQTLEVGDRRELARLGAQAQVDAEAVRAVAGRALGTPSREVPAVFEPTEFPVALGAELAPSRKLDAAGWKALSGLARYVLDKLSRNGKSERLRTAFDEIMGREQS